MSGLLRLRRGDTPHDVTVRPGDPGWLVTIGDAELRLGAEPFGPARRVADASVHELLVTTGGRAHRVVVASSRDRVLVWLDGHTYVFELADDRAGGGGGAAGTGRVVAPMPGKIIAVLVTPGARVVAGDPVAVIEAMKMETTLVAEVNGTVAAVHTEVGASVDGDALLVEITPDDAPVG
jgi:3-methylcrotonyl-CoA carboxylase alpha subunit